MTTVAPALEESEDSPSGSSLRGSHRLASVDTCERLWAFRYYWHYRSSVENEWRLGGSLIHTCYQYYYASLMPKPPQWYFEKPLHDRLQEQALAIEEPKRTELFHMALANFSDFIKWYGEDDKTGLRPLLIEEEMQATLGELDPGGPWPELDNDIVTCRNDLVYETISNGMISIMDYKTHGRSKTNPRTGRLTQWKPNGEYAINFQVLMNLHIARARLGSRVRDFVIHRTTRQVAPQINGYDFDRNVVVIPFDMYQDTPRQIRELVKHEYDVMAKIERGESPSARSFACQGRFGSCFTPETFVTTDDGGVPINEVAPGTRVLTHDGYSFVDKTAGRWYDGELIDLVVERRRPLPISSTPEHPILIRRGQRDLWVKARHVREDDRVHVAMHIPSEKTAPVKDLAEAELLGLFLAEGHSAGYVGRTRDTWCGTRLTWSYSHAETDLADRTVALIDKVYNMRGTIKKSKTALNVKLQDAKLAVQYMLEFGHRAPNKRVPVRIADAEKSIVLTCLAAWMKGDGGDTDARVYGTTSSKRMTLQWLAVLARHGVHPTVGQNSCDGGVIDGRRIARRYTQYAMSFSGEAWEAIGPFVNREYQAHRSSEVETTENSVLLRVRAIRSSHYVGPVYNLEVDDAHSYVADGYMVHNCDYLQVCRLSSKEAMRNVLNNKDKFSQPSQEELQSMRRRLRVIQ